MRWLDRWRALTERIDGLFRAVEILTSALSTRGQIDTYQVVGKSLLPELMSINGDLQRLGQDFDGILPPDARVALREYLRGDWFKGLNHDQLASMAPLAVFRSRFDFAVRDAESSARSAIELAFEHLRRLIIVDPHIRELWATAFHQGEPRCEKLGAVHLLAHGIWGFKISGAGAATDLVLNEPLQTELGLIQRTAHSIVLTEWKLVRDADELEQKASEARAQAGLYASGILGSLELKRTRYVVLVAQEALLAPGDIQLGDVLYRHVVLAVSPETPSVAARKIGRP